MRGTGPTSRRNDDDNNDLSACVERIDTDASLAEWSMAAVPKTEKTRVRILQEAQSGYIRLYRRLLIFTMEQVGT